jgi:hypothetical protein
MMLGAETTPNVKAAMKHLEAQDYRLGGSRCWYPPPHHVVTREDWEAVKLLSDHCGTGLLAQFSPVAAC